MANQQLVTSGNTPVFDFYAHFNNCAVICVLAYPGSDVASLTYFLKAHLSCAIRPASRIVICSPRLMSSSHCILGLPRPLLPATLPSITVFCTESCRAVCPKNFIFLCFTARSSSSFSRLQTLRISTLVTCFVKGILKIFLAHLFSKAVILFSTPLVYTQDSHP